MPKLQDIIALCGAICAEKILIKQNLLKLLNTRYAFLFFIFGLFYNIFQDINLDDFETIEKLEELGSERLCELLMLRGLKTGGSTNERADRLLKVKGLERAEYPAELCAPR